MRRRIIMITVLAGCLPGAMAKADFRLKDAGSGVARGAISDRSDSAKPVTSEVLDTGDEAPAAPDKPPVPYARGFGHAVPLSFAARQIVPRNVAIRFGVGVDQSLPVNWTGSRPWNLVMGAAVKPLHLHLTFNRTSVLIS